MKTEIQKFNFEGNQFRVQTDSRRETWFRGDDVCASIGIANSRHAIGRLDSDQKKAIKEVVNNVVSNDVIAKRGQPPVYVNQSGLYTLLLTGRLRKDSPRYETVKRFRRWVTDVVLPAVDRHGLPGASESQLVDNLRQEVVESVMILARKRKDDILELLEIIREQDDKIERLALRQAALESKGGIHRTAEMDADNPHPMTLRDYVTRCRVLDEYGDVITGRRLAKEGVALGKWCRSNGITMWKVEEGGLNVSVYPVSALDQWRIRFDQDNRRPTPTVKSIAGRVQFQGTDE